ncbi:TPR_1 domain-containing protein/TPR_11 domain-containing protein, partial [Cephalotus follicularis]
MKTFVCGSSLQIPCLISQWNNNPKTRVNYIFTNNKEENYNKIENKAEIEVEEIRVCTHRSCRKQGSTATLETLTGLAPPNVSVKSCACLGRCGSGPNLALLPASVILSHCGTPARAAQRAELEIQHSDFYQAELLLSQALDLYPFGGIHIIYKHRSCARLALGNYNGALEDANEALTLSPQYTEAYICQGDAFMALHQYDAAEKSYSTCLEIDPSILRSKFFKVSFVF